MLPTLLARTVLCMAGWIADRQLARNIVDGALGNILWALQKARRAELKSKS